MVIFIHFTTDTIVINWYNDVIFSTETQEEGQENITAGEVKT